MNNSIVTLNGDYAISKTAIILTFRKHDAIVTQFHGFPSFTPNSSIKPQLASFGICQFQLADKLAEPLLLTSESNALGRNARDDGIDDDGRRKETFVGKSKIFFVFCSF